MRNSPWRVLSALGIGRLLPWLSRTNAQKKSLYMNVSRRVAIAAGAGRHRHEHYEIEPPAELRAAERDHRRQKQGEDDAGDDDHQGVQVVVGDLGLRPDGLIVGEAQAVGGPGEVAVQDRVAVWTQGCEDRPEQGKQPQCDHRDQERMEDDAGGPDAPARLAHRDPRSGDCDRAHASVLITRDRKATIGTREMRRRMTAIAEPNPTRLASLMRVLEIRIE